MIEVKCLCTSDIEKIILDEFERLEIKNYGEIHNDVPFYVMTFTWFNPILEEVVKDRETLATCLAACWNELHITEEEVRRRAYELFEFYDDSDIVPDWRDKDGY